MLPNRAPAKSHSHPILVRATHWLNVIAMVLLAMSGMGIYNAHPILPFAFPEIVTLGGWLGAHTAWHFAAMWLLIGNGLVYILYGIASGSLRRRLLPIRPQDIAREIKLALKFRLQHDTGSYNATQKFLYVTALLLGALMVASGLAIWKPVQFWWLTKAFGGFDIARVVHFVGMASIMAFVALHLVMVLLVPSTLLSMTIGHRSRSERRCSDEDRS
ncbi:cytochrome b/b6 domain-containing protein (plasmid) [Rhizobium sp. CC1099]|uniref:cytochrome b/b6 domain-containing protein n=1 Tax=Rhizobium sp. CC1099 TaxID=3039160 RepID=UPI0024B1D6F7|nr:cytochrome b/b6 domain-containing protein [Rhizobium sp. CC1099]WFU92198.1 cytochrome b/b6 domain-containing protein [Rhizobium sp. CC1099]